MTVVAPGKEEEHAVGDGGRRRAASPSRPVCSKRFQWELAMALTAADSVTMSAFMAGSSEDSSNFGSARN